MDPDFEKLHASILEKVNATLMSIDLNFRLKNLKGSKSVHYRKLRSALLLWKETYSNPSDESEIVDGLTLLNNVINELK